MFSLKKHICSIISILLVLMLTTLCAISACAMDTAQGQQYSTNSNGETYGDNLQARQLGYEADLIAKGISAGRIRKYGFAFEGKQVLIG